MLLLVPAPTRHMHEDHETALNMVSGRVGMWFGPLEHYLEVQPGDFRYIPADMSCTPVQPRATPRGHRRSARLTHPNEQESVVAPQLEHMHPAA